MPDNGAVSPRDTFGKKAERYEQLEIFSEERYYQPLLELVRPAAGERALDLAAGTGLLARAVKQVTAFDITPEMLERARARIAAAGLTNVDFVEGESASLPFPDGSFELITCRTALHHFSDPRRALAEAHRVLAPGGRLAIEDVLFDGDPRSRPVRETIEKLLDPSHVRAYTVQELSGKLAAAAFAVERVVSPETKALPLEFLLRVNLIEDPALRHEIVTMLEENVDRDLGGFAVWREGDGLMLKWETMIVLARRS